jgi:DNA-binding transcriptional ArsR family regulator
MTAADPRLDLLKQLADPLRLRIIDRLGHLGPASVSELSAGLDVPMPQLSNHLRRLREADLVTVERKGRHAVYDLANPGVETLLPLLDRLTGRTAEPRVLGERADFAYARSCYRHLAGALGSDIYKSLLDRNALDVDHDGTIELGPEAEPVFATLGVDTRRPTGTRKRFAFECLDSTELRPHLAGLMGDRVAEAMIDKGWIEEPDSERVVQLTPAGKRGLKRTLGLELKR